MAHSSSIRPLQVLLYTNNIKAAENELNMLQGHITHIFSPYVFVARISSLINSQELKFSSTIPPLSLDETSLLLVEAWKEKEKKITNSKYAEKKISSWGSSEPISLNDAHKEPPHQQETDSNIPKRIPPETSQYMQGQIAVGLIVVSGVSEDGKHSYNFSNNEKIKIFQEVFEGLDFLANAEPAASITFNYHVYFPSIVADPSPPNKDREEMEKVWRDPALLQIGYQSGLDGVKDFVNAIRPREPKLGWAYAAFFTKYPTGWFAYTPSPRNRVIMNYQSFIDHFHNHNVDDINQVFAHESCHVFGAADEYNDPSRNPPALCSCDRSGMNQVPNNNCINCDSGYHVNCLMGENTLYLCQYSRGQIGWLAAGPIQGFQSSQQVGLAAFNDQLYLAYAGIGDKSSENVFISSTQSSTEWPGLTWPQNPQIVNGWKAPHGLTLAEFKGKLFMAYAGASDPYHVYVPSSTDGVNWPELGKLENYRSRNGIGMAVFGIQGREGIEDALCIAYVGTDKNLYLGYSFDGNSWPSKSTHIKGDSSYAVPWRSEEEVSLCAFKDNLYLGYTGRDGRIYVPFMDHNLKWPGILINPNHQLPPSYTSYYGVSLATIGSGDQEKLTLVYVGKDNHIYMASSTDGYTWPEYATRLSDWRTKAVPRLVKFKDYQNPQRERLYIFHIEEGNRYRIMQAPYIDYSD